MSGLVFSRERVGDQGRRRRCAPVPSVAVPISKPGPATDRGGGTLPPTDSASRHTADAAACQRDARVPVPSRCPRPAPRRIRGTTRWHVVAMQCRWLRPAPVRQWFPSQGRRGGAGSVPRPPTYARLRAVPPARGWAGGMSWRRCWSRAV